MTLESIVNYLALEENLLTGGQPDDAQLRAAAQAGVQTVINLGRHDSDYALPDEAGLVRTLGMEYVHIPVIWTAPTPADLRRFMDEMDARRGRRLLVHCAMNMRVSTFIACYRILRLGWPREVAFIDLHRIWDPREEPAWSEFLSIVLEDGS